MLLLMISMMMIRLEGLLVHAVLMLIWSSIRYIHGFLHYQGFILQTANPNDDRVPLIPTDFSSIEEAIHNFTAVFEAR
jgi:hypothetical protein